MAGLLADEVEELRGVLPVPAADTGTFFGLPDQTVASLKQNNARLPGR